MAMKTYVLVVKGRVAEPPVTLASTIDPATVFARGLTFAETTNLATQPAVGEVATDTGGVWSFAAAPSAESAGQAAFTAPAPMFVTGFQFKSALSATAGAGGASLLGNVNAWMATQPEETQLTWAQASGFLRAGAFVAALQAQFAWSSAQVDGFFHAAALVSVRA